MLVFRRTGFALEKISDLKKLPDIDRQSLVKAEKQAELNFLIPYKYTNNTERSIYKVGFLCNFLKEIYPDKTFKDICEILNNRYQILLGRRQIERLLSRYNNEELYQE